MFSRKGTLGTTGFLQRRINQINQLVPVFIPLQQSGYPVCSGHQDVSHFWKKVMGLEALVIIAGGESPAWNADLKRFVLPARRPAETLGCRKLQSAHLSPFAPPLPVCCKYHPFVFSILTTQNDVLIWRSQESEQTWKHLIDCDGLFGLALATLGHFLKTCLGGRNKAIQ